MTKKPQRFWFPITYAWQWPSLGRSSVYSFICRLLKNYLTLVIIIKHNNCSVLSCSASHFLPLLFSSSCFRLCSANRRFFCFCAALVGSCYFVCLPFCLLSYIFGFLTVPLGFVCMLDESDLCSPFYWPPAISVFLYHNTVLEFLQNFKFANVNGSPQCTNLWL